MIGWAVGVFFLLMLAWLAAGRQITLLIDRMIPFRAASLAVNPLSYDGGGFVIGGQQLTFGLTNNQRAGLKLRTDASNRVFLCSGRDGFVLGPRINPIDPHGRPEIQFAADHGDQLSLTARQSLFGWPTPFEISFMTSHTPWWKKYVYYRLVWKKPSGARLEMRWLYQRDYYRRGGWTDPLMKWDFHTGLQAVEIRPESAGAEGAVVRYIAGTKHWNRSEYTIERRGPTQDGLSEVFAVIHLCEACGAVAGGKPIELYVDRGREVVTREFGGE